MGVRWVWEVSGVAVSGIVGRDGEVGRLGVALSAVAAGRGGVVWVGGEPGIGKSALVDAGLAGAGLAGVRVFRGVADELTQSFGLRLMVDCLGVYRVPVDEFRREITDVLAGRAGGVDPVRAAGEQVVALVQRECARAPVVLVGDDLQWADEASLEVWHRLAHLVGQEPLLLVGVCRPVPQRVEVDRVRDAVAQVPDAVLVELGPLGPAEVAAMAAALLSAVPGPSLRAGLGQAGGNPLYVREMLDVLVAEGRVAVAGGVAEVAGPLHPVVSSLSAAIGHRLGFLSEPARSALQGAAVLGVRFSTDELALVTGESIVELAAVMDDAVAAGVLAHIGEELMFRHALIRQALHEQMPAAVRIGLHAHMARALAETATPWDRVAQHLIAAPEAIDDWALTWLTALPVNALYAQPATAADLLERARQVSTPGDPRRAVLTTRLSFVLQLLRRTDQLVALGEEALTTITDHHLIGEIAWNLSRVYHASGRGEDGLKMISRVLDGLDPGMPWRGRLRARRATHLISAGRVDEAVAQARMALAEGERDRDPMTIGVALNVLIIVAGETDALEIIDRGLTVLVGEDPELTDLRLMFLTNRVVMLTNLDRATEFEDALAQTIAVAERQGSTRVIFLHLTGAAHHLEHGNWDQALSHLDQVADLPSNPYDSLIKTGYAALIATWRGERAAAERHIAAVADIPYTTSGVLFLIAAGPVSVAKALLAEAQGDLTAAVQILSVLLDPSVAGNAYARGHRAEYLPELVRLATAAGDRVTAEVVVAAIEADAQADPDLSMRAGMCRAMVEDDPVPLLAAADHFDRVGRLPEVAFALQEAAVRLAMRGDIPAARGAFGRAVTIYEDLGAVLDLRRMQARLRPHGIRSGSHAAHRRATTGWDALTAAEHAVAALVAEGHSNPDIATRMYLSRRTIAAHVAHIMTKLQLRSRLEIARELTRHNQPGSAAIA